MIKYLGSKRALMPFVVDAIQQAGGEKASVIDLFSGTSRVGHALKARGHRVLANDHNAYAYTLAQCYVAADRASVYAEASKLVDEFNRMPGEPGYFTKTFCEDSMFFRPRNGARIDAIREAIEEKCLRPELRSVMLVSLMEAADRVDSTCGVQMAYLKKWAKRSENELELRVPAVLDRAAGGKGEAHQLDALEAAESLEADVAYLDPPYNQHSYRGNYHIWESLVLWDKPEVYGVACKRVDCRSADTKSDFNSKRRFTDALTRTVESVRAQHLIVSFNDEGYISRPHMEELLSRRGAVSVAESSHKRYVGAQIGIYNPQGERVGEVGHRRNTEYLYTVEVSKPAAVTSEPAQLAV